MKTGRDPVGVPEFTPHRPIVMIGPMAVGKSVIGAELARVLGVEFIDSDQKIVAKHGPVPRIFAARGEHHFRQLEAKTIAAVLDSPKPKPVVLSLGGGAVLDSGTQQLLARATVVFLRADIDTVRERITRNTGRPLLAADPVGTWQRLAAARGPVYDRLADITLDVSRSNVPQLVVRLIEQLADASRKENLQP
ncbi:shikimate kinase [Arthrobacter sp. E3]|uniref:shikimate kinase n=1 Tax=Arthrobacter sp. E3 TaxID=517402 RepID=UPI001A93BDBB|nr:shikimate kinase [Arthrobacter sp. E3]